MPTSGTLAQQCQYSVNQGKNKIILLAWRIKDD